MDYKKTETEIIEATKEFATINNIHYDELTESMLLNAMRELNKCFITDVVGQSEQFVCDYCGDKKEQEFYHICEDCHLDSIQ